MSKEKSGPGRKKLRTTISEVSEGSTTEHIKITEVAAASPLCHKLNWTLF